MPRAIASRMYCVNLLDIFLTPSVPAIFKLRQSWSVADLERDATSLRHFARLPKCSGCGMRARRLAFNAAHNVCNWSPRAQPIASRTANEQHAEGESHECNRQPPDPADRK